MIAKSRMKKGLACLTLGVACALCGVGSVSLTGKTHANATVFENASLVSTQASVSDENGLRISSDTEYTCKINGVFRGNTSFKFDFPETGDYFGGDFVFTFADAANPENSFNVEYYVGNAWGSSEGYTNVAMNYKQKYRTCRYWDERWYNNKVKGHETAYAYPSFLSRQEYVAAGEPGNRDGMIMLEWVGDVLNVRVSMYTTAMEYYMFRIASFDGTDEFSLPTDVNNKTCGLPKIAFDYGFTVSVSSSFSHSATEDRGTDVTFESITTGGVEYDLTNAITDAPDFYTDYINRKEITVADHEDFSVISIKEKITIPAATWACGENSGEVSDIKVITPSTQKTVHAGEEFTPTELGNHKIFYTYGEDVAYRDFDVWESLVRATDQFAVTGATPQFVNGKDGTGVEIASGKPYSGQINGTFFGDTTITFRFTEESDEYIAGDFKFRISDAEDESVFFDVEYSVVNVWDLIFGYTGAHVNYQGNYRSSRYWDSHVTWYNTRATGDETVYSGPNFLKRSGWYVMDLDGILALDYDENGVLGVFVSSYNTTDLRPIAKFDGTTIFLSGSSWGLPRMPFENGYKISFSSSVKSSYDGASDVLFKSIETGGGKFAFEQNALNVTYDFRVDFRDAAQNGDDVYLPQGDTVGTVKGYYSLKSASAEWIVKTVDLTVNADTSAVGTKTLTIADNSFEDVWEAVEKEYTLHVETPYTLTFDTQGGDPIAPILYSEHTQDRVVVKDAERLFWEFTGWKLNYATFNGDLSKILMKNVTLKAQWKDLTAPTIMLMGRDFVTMLKNQTLTVSSDDVEANDAAQNDSVKLTIEVKTPNGEFAKVTTGYELELSETGIYQIRYTAKDGANLTSNVVRQIKVIDRNSPTMSVNGDYTASGYTGLNIALANVTAKDQDGTDLSVVVTVVNDGETVAVNGNAFLAEKVGVYTVTYTAEDAFDLLAIYSYQITVTKDTVKPTLTTTLKDTAVVLNTTVTVPDATVSDNVADGVTTEVKVTFGMDAVELSGNAFVAEKVGVYTVTYTVTDKAGNQTQQVVLITAKESLEDADRQTEPEDPASDEPASGDPASDEPASGGSGCGSMVSGGPLMAVAVLGAVAFMLMKKRKEN